MAARRRLRDVLGGKNVVQTRCHENEGRPVQSRKGAERDGNWSRKALWQKRDRHLLWEQKGKSRKGQALTSRDLQRSCEADKDRHSVLRKRTRASSLTPAPHSHGLAQFSCVAEFVKFPKFRARRILLKIRTGTDSFFLTLRPLDTRPIPMRSCERSSTTCSSVRADDRTWEPTG
jgi:hypothetical protein